MSFVTLGHASSAGGSVKDGTSATCLAGLCGRRPTIPLDVYQAPIASRETVLLIQSGTDHPRILSATLAPGSLVLCGQIVGGETMGDKGGKKGKQKEQKQKTDQKQHEAKVKQDKQPKRKTG